MPENIAQITSRLQEKNVFRSASDFHSTNPLHLGR